MFNIWIEPQLGIDKMLDMQFVLGKEFSVGTYISHSWCVCFVKKKEKKTTRKSTEALDKTREYYV